MTNNTDRRAVFMLAFSAFAIILCWLGYYHIFGKGLCRPMFVPQADIIHLGEVQPNSLIETELAVTNKGIRPLMISSMRSGCSGCIKVLSYPDTSIKRNETGVLHFALNTRSLTGKVRKAMVVLSNDPVRPVYPILIDAVVKGQEELPQ